MAKEKLTIERYFSKPSSHPIEYIKSDVNITDENGKVLFVQKDVEFPNYFSGLSKQIIASRYFYGERGTAEREQSFRQVVEGINGTYKGWGIKQGYFNKNNAGIFSEELTNLMLTQKFAPNSPVWFNVRTHNYESRRSNEKKEGWIIKNGKAVEIPAGMDYLYPQTSACFIQGVEDTLESIMKLAVNEAMLFKHGSGTGTDLSTLRSSKEKLSGGGKPTGPLGYFVHYDKLAGIVKSGGKTRRAAKMHSLRVDHPDVKEFIEAKSEQEKYINILIGGGINETKAIENVHYQNTNVSIRVTDEFMKAVENDEEWRTLAVHNHELNETKNPDGSWVIPRHKARDLLHMIAEGTHKCGDPGMQYDTTINKWHTCPNSGKINASNPCSEYMFINDSSCNLASLNLMSFVDENGKFKVRDFKKAVRTIAIAMDLNYDNSRFPTKEIAQNSHDFRPLGMGYANLGALIMSLGLPYDSDEARNIAGAITSLMTATVYEASNEMARKIGPFKEFKKNKESMMNVIKMHEKYSKELVKNIKSSDRKINFNVEEIVMEADKTWKYDVRFGYKSGFRNAQATVLAPTGTIGFAMDADTKGVESEIGLVQTKLLSEGGTLRMVNNTVPLALKNLGYNQNEIKMATQYAAGHSYDAVPHIKTEHIEELKKLKNANSLTDKLKEFGYGNEERDEIRKYVFGYETLEGCPIIKPEHIAVFDCSNKPEWAKRTIAPSGHIKMMAAVQPFLSGAISKTVNLPKEATVEEIENVYMEAWKLGLKAVALYRDESKNRQPMSFTKSSDRTLEGKIETPEIKSGEPFRRKLPGTRNSITHKFNVAGHEGYLTVGLYEDGSPGELFITMSKEGSTVGGLMDVIGTSTSMNLQYGVPIKTLVNKFKNSRFEPWGYVDEGHSDIKDTQVTSTIDYIFKWMEKTFIEGKRETANYQINEKASGNIAEDISKKPKDAESKGELTDKFCPCGARLLLKGHCQEICSNNCGYVNYNGCAG